MDIYTRIYCNSFDFVFGKFDLGQNPGSTRIAIDVTLQNTIYNIPADTVYEFKGSGSYTPINLTKGYYSLASICATIKAACSVIVPDFDCYRDPITGCFTISSPTTPTTAIRLTKSSSYLCSLLGGFPAEYTGSLITLPNIMSLYPGLGIYLQITGIPFENPPAINQTQFGTIFIPWQEFGAIMTDDDRNMPRVYCLQPNQAVNSITAVFYDIYNNIIDLNGGDFTLCLNLLNSV